MNTKAKEKTTSDKKLKSEIKKSVKKIFKDYKDVLTNLSK
jgi:hypothetical protein